MRVFVTGTGRCGTCTFYQACLPFKNYTVGHESKRGYEQIGDWDFSDNHIEIASNLIIGLPFLMEKYPKAKWVHLWRDKVECVRSLADSVPDAMAWFGAQFWYFHSEDLHIIKSSPTRVAEAYYDFANKQIQFYLRQLPRSQSMTLNIGEAKDLWRTFLNWIGAEVSCFDESVGCWDRKYNPKENRGRDNYARA